jgi:ribosomal protein L13E
MYNVNTTSLPWRLLARNWRESDRRYNRSSSDSRGSKITELRPFEQMLKSARGIGVNTDHLES